MIEVENVTLGYNDHIVLSNINLHIPAGQTTVILGRSGCGKSTLLKAMIGLLEPISGLIRVDGEDITSMSERELNRVRMKFGMLFQSAALFNSMTVGENVALPLREHTELHPEVVDIMVRLKLGMVDLAGCEEMTPAELSGGMKKRAGLARAMAMDPRIIFFDEPVTGLDPIISAGIDDLILHLKSAFTITLVIVTHELKHAFTVADRIVMISDGKILAEGTPDEVKSNSHLEVRQFLEGKPDARDDVPRAATPHAETG